MGAVPRLPLQPQAGDLLIDFRYHLISLIAVFLALGLGILMGSVVLSDRYVERLENRVEAIEEQSDARREEITLLNERLDSLQDFSLQVQDRVIDGVLTGDPVVIFELPRADGVLAELLTESIEGADGLVVSTIRLTERFALDDDDALAELGSILASSQTEAAQLRTEAAEALGQRASVAADRVDLGARGSSAQRLATLVEELREADFIEVTAEDETLVPPGAAFLLVGGAPEDPVSGTLSLSVNLASALSGRGAAVVATEPSGSIWGLVANLRDDPDTGAAISTVDAAETVPGRVAVVLGLDMAADGVTGHYGVGDGATAIVPPATPGD